MGLKIERNYTNKEGVVVELKTPKLKVMGKLMDDEETHTLIMLGELERHEPGTQWNKGIYVKYQMFAKYEGDEKGMNIELSTQAFFAIKSLNPVKGSRIIIGRAMKENEKTGALMPVITAKLEGSTPSPTPSPVVNEPVDIEAPPSEKEQEFIDGYMRNVNASEYSVSHFIGSYVRQAMKDNYLVKRYSYLFLNWVNPNMDSDGNKEEV